jgi:hypothetical protein
MPLTTIAISKTVEFLTSTVTDKFRGLVIDRWTRYRAEQFFQSFVKVLASELESGGQTDEVDKRLTKILTDDTRSEVLFDAYRRVCFSTSKTIGPRIIGLLTGELVHEGRMANSVEENIFAAAEMLSDGEFVEFMKGYQEHRKKAEGITDSKAKQRMLGESVIVRWLEESSDGSFASGNELDIGSFPWEEALGRWAVKLKQANLLEDRIQQQFQNQATAYGSDLPFSTKVVTTITFNPGCLRLYDLVSRSLGPDVSP